MDDRRSQRPPAPASAPASTQAVAGQPGVIGIALAAVLSASLAQGSWQWFALYIGVTLLAIVVAFFRLPVWAPGLRSGYVVNLVAFSLVVGLCVALALAPMMQRWAWLFPMPGTRDRCEAVGAYARLEAEAALGSLAHGAGGALAYAQETQAHAAVADCLSATTTLWLPVYAAGAALLVGLTLWALGWARSRSRGAANPRPS
ncbi:hypothetical protein ACGFRB_21730 [Streptomyces sp. NPDC048718]|uniref:hypothetical protein n=1 Tax=Streptomyces sp. NPDC048718 TaxID=3365587 RepID=UPI0037179F66